ncbi:hypothetical protein BBO99_00001173 [Phytophthora kernoviae]|uniref:Uncharacterized protein n=2 Tax=Phytophthora kernoviae TaxID=325452 RepID=A0A3R7JA84_9STRA|nr:hypothetical protein G195_005142 [Phytophthora kernoviae 00238/432]KAG2531121.1 hypothetical protein JM16_001269 [Phytophthora kernoviae]RLN26630.1 hypothetical protein BBI17_004062 [Phytophthora kernoviae]RLN84692.1 hypothetical protein BBO99_00001173 [Phytophthora kernoviae]
MGKRRAIRKMLTVSDGYWGFVHQKRFYRWAYASLTFFAIFAVVVAFFDVGAGTSYAASFVASRYTQGELDENERLLQWVYVFYPTPFAFAWFLVYFAKFLFCWKIKRLRKARNYNAVVIGLCELGLVGIEVFDERKERKERHRRKKMLRDQQEAEENIYRQNAKSDATLQQQQQQQQQQLTQTKDPASVL